MTHMRDSLLMNHNLLIIMPGITDSWWTSTRGSLRSWFYFHQFRMSFWSWVNPPGISRLYVRFYIRICLMLLPKITIMAGFQIASHSIWLAERPKVRAPSSRHQFEKKTYFNHSLNFSSLILRFSSSFLFSASFCFLILAAARFLSDSFASKRWISNLMHIFAKYLCKTVATV